MLAGMLPSAYVPSGILIECSFTLFSILPLPNRSFESVGQYNTASVRRTYEGLNYQQHVFRNQKKINNSQTTLRRHKRFFVKGRR